MKNICAVLVCLVFVANLILTSAFHFPVASRLTSHQKVCTRKNGVKSLSAVLDVLAGAALSFQLSTSPISGYHPISSNTLTIADAEVKQGLYKEYTIDRVDDSALDSVKRTYKTAEETDESKSKYWAILAVLVAGSFIIPMVQYYWYIAEED